MKNQIWHHNLELDWRAEQQETQKNNQNTDRGLDKKKPKKFQKKIFEQKPQFLFSFPIDCSVLTVSIWGEQGMFFMLSYLVFPLERHLNGLCSPQQISLVLWVKKKIFWQTGILHIGPK